MHCNMRTPQKTTGLEAPAQPRLQPVDFLLHGTRQPGIGQPLRASCPEAVRPGAGEAEHQVGAELFADQHHAADTPVVRRQMLYPCRRRVTRRPLSDGIALASDGSL